jgi:hypothetical protein
LDVSIFTCSLVVATAVAISTESHDISFGRQRLQEAPSRLTKSLLNHEKLGAAVKDSFKVRRVDGIAFLERVGQTAMMIDAGTRGEEQPKLGLKSTVWLEQRFNGKQRSGSECDGLQTPHTLPKGGHSVESGSRLAVPSTRRGS